MHKFFSISVCTAACCFFSLELSYGQCSGISCPSPDPQADPMNSCVVSDPNELCCFIGATTPDPAVVFPTWCGTNTNTQWFAFTAIAATTSFAISNGTCSQGNVLNAAVFSSSDCVNFSTISNCISVASNQTATVTANNMVPGQVYFLCVGGNNGAICDFQINPPGWSGLAVNCVLESLPGMLYHAYATDAVWSVEPSTAATFNPPIGAYTDITWLESGNINLCVSSATCPEFCQTVEIAGGVFEEHLDLCPGKSVTCAGEIYSAPGIYTITEPDGPWCFKTTHCNIHLLPTAFSTETAYMCQNSSVTCAGEEFFGPGTFPVTLVGPNGCDSIVSCTINMLPPSPITNLMINLCGPAEYQVCDNMYYTSGNYTEICTNWLGCDSIINLNLAILEPHAAITPPGILNCQSDTIITLNGSNSSVNTAQGGTTLYLWTGPGIIGSSNTSTVQVDEAGTYCLVLTHTRGPLICRDTACVQVTASSAVPSLPQVSGIMNPCLDSTYVYSATANGAVTSFDWTLAGNQPYTTLSLNSIQVTWDSIVTGPICVTANNACGASQPACQPIVVQMPVQQPVLSGPGAVCANGGNYMFTLNIEQSGVHYNWTTPIGAVLTGTGDTVNVNFQGSVSGQVCVTPENACGPGVPVCQNVQVNPVPVADLSSDAQICAGDTVNLNFMLTGNSPFDVIWSIDNQSFTLNDIQNGHVVSVHPTQTSVYTITNISDNSAIACNSVVSDSVRVTVWQPSTAVVTAQICLGESLFVGGGAQFTSGIYTDTLHTFQGCDSVIVTTLTVMAIDTTVLNNNTCDPALAGSNMQMLTQLNGCDSVVITVTTLQPSDTTLILGSSCDMNNVGVFTQNLSNVYGCDSIVVTTILFSLADTTLVNATTCDPAAVGVFTHNLLSIAGCDSLVITSVSLLPSNTTILFGATCNPANAGVFTAVLPNQFGCDSTVITTITLAPLPTTFLTTTSCDPALAGVFTNHINTADGCDSVIATTVILLPSSTTMLTGTSCNPANVGVFTTVSPNQFGCDSTLIRTITLAPLPTTFLTTTSCDPALTGVFTNHINTADGCDSVIVTTVNLLPSSTTMLTGTSCNPANVGVFTDVWPNQFGCDSTVITTITLAPLPTTFLTTASCDPALTGVFTNHINTADGCDSVIVTTINLLPSNQTTLTATTCDPALAGVFVDTLINQFGCDSTIVTVTSLLPVNSCSVAATLTGSTIPCVGTTGTLTLMPTVGMAPFSYTVLQGATIMTSGTVPVLGTQQVISDLPAGSYTVNITSPNGFSTTTQAVVVQLVPPGLTSMANSNYTGFDVRCQGATDGSALATAAGGSAPYIFSWSNGGNSQQINNLAAGIYTVTVIDANGCTNVSTVALTEPTSLALSFIVNGLDCFGENDGAIQVEISGGAAPYLFSLNNGPVQSANIFTGLDSGVYSLTAADANDCLQTDVIAVNAATLLNVTLGDDIHINLGDNATLQATVNVPLDSILSVVWSPPLFDSLECVPPLCLTQTVTPFISTVYSIQVQALNGCTDQDNVTVIVDRRRQIYVPNVFSPNDDGANDLFTIYAKPGAVSKILSLQVFDRWGEAIITLKDFLPNSPTIGWDGRYKGDPMNPGVFVWIAEIEFIDGQREFFKGDVTIVR
jgi:gliding motility-associated-like protein